MTPKGQGSTYVHKNVWPAVVDRVVSYGPFMHFTSQMDTSIYKLDVVKYNRRLLVSGSYTVSVLKSLLDKTEKTSALLDHKCALKLELDIPFWKRVIEGFKLNFKDTFEWFGYRMPRSEFWNSLDYMDVYFNRLPNEHRERQLEVISQIPKPLMHVGGKLQLKSLVSDAQTRNLEPKTLVELARENKSKKPKGVDISSAYGQEINSKEYYREKRMDKKDIKTPQDSIIQILHKRYVQQ